MVHLFKLSYWNHFSTTDNLMLKSSFKNRDHIQKKEHGPSSNYQFRDVCIQTEETMNLSLNKYFILFYSVSLTKQYISETILKKKEVTQFSLNDGHWLRC